MSVLSWLWQVNLLLAAFNLVPAAPLDGGRILRAGLWRAMGSRARASVLAARAGLGFGVVLIAAGLVEFARGSAFGLWPAFLGWFLFTAARAEGDMARRSGEIEGVTVGAVMTPGPPVVPAAMSVAELLAGPLSGWDGHDVAVVVGPTGWLAGVVTLERIGRIPGSLQATTPLGAIADPIEAVPVGRPDEAVFVLLERMLCAGGRPAVVLDTANRVAGTVTMGDVERHTRHLDRSAAPVT